MEVVSNPAVPYYGAIYDGLRVGKIITISGHVPYGSDRFNIDFSQGGYRNDANIGLHFNPRFDQNEVVRNSRVNGQWESEERRPHTLPFSIGNDFQVIFLVENTHFKIAVNGRHFVEFKHRLPIHTLNNLSIEGIVRIKSIAYSWQTPQAVLPVPCYPSQPQVCPPGPFVPPPSRTSLQPVYNPVLPFKYPFYDGLNTGQMIYISGRPTAYASRFSINLETSAAPYPPPDIALHFNPRFDQRAVVRNSRINNHWGDEERHASMFPFALGVNFDLIIRVDCDAYMIAINGKHFVEFRHRYMPLSRVNTLTVDGDAIISCIKFQ